MKAKIIGVILIMLAILGAVTYKFATTGSIVTIKGFVGGEKIGFLENEEVQEILKKNYKVNLDFTKAGSIEMVKMDTNGLDFLFPSSQVALELYKSQQHGKVSKSETVLTTPIVIYSWDIVVDALEKQGIVKMENNTYYILDMGKMLEMIKNDTKWADIGLPELYGKIGISTTDPVKSNSGNMFAGLTANVLNGGDVVNDSTIDSILPDLKIVFIKLGYMESSSGDLFDQYLRTGVGSKPLVAGYESQIIEFAYNKPDDFAQVKNKVRILYPRPTVWSAHPFIALNENAIPAINGLMDKRIQEIAWENHGFRIGTAGTLKRLPILDQLGIPDSITSVMPMPNYQVMERIIAELENNR